MTDKEKKSKIADILMDFQEEYSNEVINRPMLASLYAGNILSFIDSLQEEPKFKTGDRIKPIDSCLGSPRTIVDICDSWYVTDQGALDFEYENNWELAEEPISEDLGEAAENYSREYKSGESELSRMIQETVKDIFIDGAKWQKRQIMKEAVDGTMGFATIRLEAPNFGNKYKEGEKVKMIFIKED